MDFDTNGFDILLEYLETLLNRHQQGIALDEEESELLNLYLKNVENTDEFWEQIEARETVFESSLSESAPDFPLFEADALLDQGWEFMISEPFDA